MRPRLTIVLFPCLLLALAACTPPQPAPRTAGTALAVAQGLIVVRDFRVNSSTRVVVDTSFGFALDRGPGVPLQKRADSISRAAAFDVADALTDRLRQLGYTAVHASRYTPIQASRALAVVGTLREVNEGHRRDVGHEHADVIADAEIDEATPGLTPLLAVHVDSRQLAEDGAAGTEGPGAPAFSIAAARVGREIANSVVKVAQQAGISPTAAR